MLIRLMAARGELALCFMQTCCRLVWSAMKQPFPLAASIPCGHHTCDECLKVSRSNYLLPCFRHLALSSLDCWDTFNDRRYDLLHCTRNLPVADQQQWQHYEKVQQLYFRLYLCKSILLSSDWQA